jgi:hypothetical protein
MGMLHRRTVIGTVAALSLTLGGCSFGSGSSNDHNQKVAKNFMEDGAITISRPAPAAKQQSVTSSMLAFLPVESQKKGKWVSIDRTAGTIQLMSNDESLIIAKGKGLDALKPGTYKIMHKQRSAPWHASESYFQKRNLEIPAAGSKDRFLRGALGQFVIFLNEELPVHSGPIWSEDIGGIQVSEKELSRIYYSVNAGASVEVQ